MALKRNHPSVRERGVLPVALFLQGLVSAVIHYAALRWQMGSPKFYQTGTLEVHHEVSSMFANVRKKALTDCLHVFFAVHSSYGMCVKKRLKISKILFYIAIFNPLVVRSSRTRPTISVLFTDGNHKHSCHRAEIPTFLTYRCHFLCSLAFIEGRTPVIDCTPLWVEAWVPIQSYLLY